MKRELSRLCIALGLSVSLLFSAGALESYQRALVQERAVGNLQEAIRLYQQAAGEAGNDRNLAARALMGVARSYQKLGDAKALPAYEQIIRTYPEQREAVMAAQLQLASMR